MPELYDAVFGAGTGVWMVSLGAQGGVKLSRGFRHCSDDKPCDEGSLKYPIFKIKKRTPPFFKQTEPRPEFRKGILHIWGEGSY